MSLERRYGIAINLAVLGVLAVSAYEQFHILPELKESTVRNLPACSWKSDLSYTSVAASAQGLLNSDYTLEQLTQNSGFREQIECYRTAEKVLTNDGLQPNQWRNSLSLFGLMSSFILLTASGIAFLKSK